MAEDSGTGMKGGPSRGAWRLVLSFALVASPVACTGLPAPRPGPGSGGELSGLGGVVLLRGLVAGLDGRPAAGVLVRAYAVGHAGASVAPANAGALLSGGPPARRLAAAPAIQAPPPAIQATTDAQGRFRLKAPPGPLNLEAVQSEQVKAFLAGARADEESQLRLAYTGAISGRVVAPGQPGVTDFEGVDVFVPGTSYVAKTDAAGRYGLANVAAGVFGLVASKAGLGRGGAAGVQVRSRETTQVAPLALVPQVPTVEGVTPPVAVPGLPLRVAGRLFGASSSAPLLVTLGGSVLASARRLDDATLDLEIPEEASGGDLVVSVDGMAGRPFPVPVARSVAVSPARDALLLGAEQAFSLMAADAHGKALGEVPAAWGFMDGAHPAAPAVAVDVRGHARALAEGEGVLTATAGRLTAALPLAVRRLVGAAATLLEAKEAPATDGVARSLPYIRAASGAGALYLLVSGEGRLPPGEGSGVLRVSPDGGASPVRLPEAGLVADLAVAPDGGLLVLGADGALLAYPAAGGAPRTLATAADLALVAPARGGLPLLPPPGLGVLPLKPGPASALAVDEAGRAFVLAGTGDLLAPAPSGGYRLVSPAGESPLLPPIASPLVARGDVAYFLEPGAGGIALRRVDAGGARTTVPLSRSLGLAPGGLALDAQGRLYLSAPALDTIFEADPLGHMSLLVGDGVVARSRPPSAAPGRLSHPAMMAPDPGGDALYVLDGGSFVDGALLLGSRRLSRVSIARRP